jgi:hypothetical protein
MGAVFALFSAWYFWIPKILGLDYSRMLGKVHFWILFIGVNVTFFPQHFLGLQGMPRRISDYPDAFAGWNLISSFGSIISVVATWLFLYIVYVQLVEGKATSRYPWLTPQFYSDSLQTLLNRSYNSLEWALSSPPKPHAFVSLPLGSALCSHGIEGFCQLCLNAEQTVIPCVHGVQGFCQSCWNIEHPVIIACTHNWVAFTLDNLAGTACDFGSPVHTITSKTLCYTCSVCHAMSCEACMA